MSATKRSGMSLPLSAAPSGAVATPDFLRSAPKEIIGGAEVAALSRHETAQLMIRTALDARGRHSLPAIFSSANGQVISLLACASDPADPANLIKAADLVSADGQPLVFASRLLGAGGVRERCCTTDLFHDVARLAVPNGVTFFILGAVAEENEMAVANVRRLYPALQIIGHRYGYFQSESDEHAAVDRINSLAPDIVWVGLGFPRELQFCVRWRPSLTNTGLLKTSGGLFNFLSGTRSRAPEWMQAAGLEWAYRLALEPRRLFARYAATNIHAAWLLLTRTERALRRRP